MAAKYNLTIPQGETYDLDLSLNRNDVDYDLTDCTIYGTIRDSYNAGSYTEFDIEYVSRNQGKFRLKLNKEKSENLNPGNGVYDVVLHIPLEDDAEQVIRLLEGTAKITPAVTTQR